MEIQASRAGARTGPSGEPILLLDQDRARWDRLLIGRGLAALERAREARRRSRSLRVAGGDRGLPRARPEAGRHRLGAHRRAVWRTRASSPVRRSSSSTARSRWACCSVRPPGWSWSMRSPTNRRWPRYHLLPSVRGDLLHKLGRMEEARSEFERAADMTRNARERGLLLERAASCTSGNWRSQARDPGCVGPDRTGSATRNGTLPRSAAPVKCAGDPEYRRLPFRPRR